MDIREDQINQLIAAISDGKYSWACVLMLQAFEKEPLHYIPQRTYSRLIKQNHFSKNHEQRKLQAKTVSLGSRASGR
jgi:hypothetical protein